MPPTVESLLGPVDLVAVLRVLLAAVLGGMIGLEREKHGRAAGLRTHLLLCAGCALVMLVSLYVPTLFRAHGAEGVFRADPGRIAAHVLSGLGFLGAGVIITLGRWVRGLTTAACIWVTAAIGLAVGCGYAFVALCTTAIVMFALHTLRIWERRIEGRDRYARVELCFDQPGERIDLLRNVLSGRGFRVLEYWIDQGREGTCYRLQVRYVADQDIEGTTHEMTEALSEEGLVSIRWR